MHLEYLLMQNTIAASEGPRSYPVAHAFCELRLECVHLRLERRNGRHCCGKCTRELGWGEEQRRSATLTNYRQPPAISF